MNYFLMLLFFELNAWQGRGGEKIEGGCDLVRNYANIYCIYIYTPWVYSLSTLENTDENRIFSVGSPYHKHFGKAQHLVLWTL